MTLLKREKGLYLRIRDPYVNSPEMEEVERIFRLTPGLSRYRIKSELSEEANQRLPSPLGNDTIKVNPCFVLQIMTFLSKGVCVPEEHVVLGDRSGDARGGRPAIRLDAGHRRKLRRPRAEAPSPGCGGGRSVRGVLFQHRPRRREIAGGPVHPRDRVRPPGIGRQEPRPVAYPPCRWMRRLSRRG